MKPETIDRIVKVLTDILKDFVCVRSFITLGAFGVLYSMVYKGKGAEIPDILLHIVDLLLGFWFGQKVAQAIHKKEGV